VDEDGGRGDVGKGGQGQGHGGLPGIAPRHGPVGETEAPGPHLVKAILGHGQGDAREIRHAGREESPHGGLEKGDAAPVPELLGGAAAHAHAPPAGGDHQERGFNFHA